ncbi:hypothetical protein CDAR_208821 [Caerostris darwini]|uniref:Uncharacterized protein n=1 Tax=Caerostris darwini TaxID=1538125 RepID=A0AAV4VSS4_9ARAC|nr:hypothetical protein CDAR_208821 [Caerostris darwini]
MKCHLHPSLYRRSLDVGLGGDRDSGIAVSLVGYLDIFGSLRSDYQHGGAIQLFKLQSLLCVVPASSRPRNPAPSNNNSSYISYMLRENP